MWITSDKSRVPLPPGEEATRGWVQSHLKQEHKLFLDDPRIQGLFIEFIHIPAG